MIVKAVKLRKDLKSLLQTALEGEDLILDYYGELFRIEPFGNKKNRKSNNVLEYFKNLPAKKLTNPILNENDPTQEKKNIQDYLYGTKTRKGILEK